MNTITRSNVNEQRALAFADTLRDGTSSPFRDTLGNMFQATSNLFGIACDGTAYIRLETRELLEERIAESITRSAKQDQANYNSLLMQAISTMELEAKLREMQGA